VNEAISASGLEGMSEIDAVAVAVGPGLAPCLEVGLSHASSLCKQHSLPFIAVNHLEAHSTVTQLTHKDLSYPHLTLLISGGHTQLW
jgi:N6-L-threonylcarbamoyladenine synthase